MQKLLKKPNQDFVILNLTDIHMDDNRLGEGSPFLEILYRTMDTLIERVKPDLITITGDLAWGGHHKGHDLLLAKLRTYNIPWAPVFGNHDHDAGDDVLAILEEKLNADPLCLYEAGDRAYGCGNYTLLLEEENTGRAVEGLILMDSHRNSPYVNEAGETVSGWAHLWENQLDWYVSQVESCKKLGCPETVIFQHIPPYGYKQAWDAAFRQDLNPKDMPAPLGGTDCWNPGYESSTGVHYEGVGCFPMEDGVLDVIAGTEHTKYIFCGHEHINNWQILYRGVNLVYTCKTGCGAYWHPALNGGTIIRVGDAGVKSVEHTYVEMPRELVEQA